MLYISWRTLYVSRVLVITVLTLWVITISCDFNKVADYENHAIVKLHDEYIDTIRDIIFDEEAKIDNETETVVEL